MDTSCKTAVAASLVGGYVLGRTQKAKLAFAVATFFAGRRFGLAPQALAAEGLRQFRENPKLAPLREQIRGELLTAARSAASASAERRFSSLAEKLRQRGNGTPDEGAEWPEDESEEELEEEEEEEEEEEPEEEEMSEEEEEEEEARRRRPSGVERGRARQGSPHAAKRPAAKKAEGKAPARRAEAKKTPGKRAAGKKTSSSSRARGSRQGR